MRVFIIRDVDLLSAARPVLIPTLTAAVEGSRHVTTVVGGGR